MPVPTLQGIERTDVSLAHTPSAIAARPGDQVDYTLTISNRSVKPVSVRLRALLADGVRLVAGSVLEDGEVLELGPDAGGVVDKVPADHVFVDGQRILGSAQQIAAGRT